MGTGPLTMDVLREAMRKLPDVPDNRLFPSLGPLSGTRVYIDNSIGAERVWFRRPRSRKRRIRKKWMKRPGNWRVNFRDEVLMGQGIIFCRQSQYDAIMRATIPVT